MSKLIMKKLMVYLTLITAFLLVISTLSACSSKLEGSYSKTSDNNNYTVTYTFSGKDKVEVLLVDASGKTLTSMSGKYKISGKTITFSDWSDGHEGKTTDFEVSGNSLIIYGVEYVKK